MEPANYDIIQDLQEQVKFKDEIIKKFGTIINDMLDRMPREEAEKYLTRVGEILSGEDDEFTPEDSVPNIKTLNLTDKNIPIEDIHNIKPYRPTSINGLSVDPVSNTLDNYSSQGIDVQKDGLVIGGPKKPVDTLNEAQAIAVKIGKTNAAQRTLNQLKKYKCKHADCVKRDREMGCLGCIEADSYESPSEFNSEDHENSQLGD